MLAYRLFATAISIWHWLRGESPRQPGYVANLPRRVRRSIGNLGESFAHGWPGIQRGEYAGALMLYAATIGEFHPLKPVVDAYLEQHPGTPLVILSGQLQYIDALHAAYPQAAVGIPPPCAPWLYDRLFKLTRPHLLALGEGPCLPLRFPIAFEMALPAACVRHGTPMIVVNATLHQHLVPSRLDGLEGRLFGSLYLEALKWWYTPNEIFRSWLVDAGVPAERVEVTGDLRFDGLRGLGERSSDFSELLSWLRANSGPIVVAGSVNALDEEGPVIDGWLELRGKYPDSRLIIAPRHVNAAENMGRLYGYLDAKGIRYEKRSAGGKDLEGSDVLVVDVFGELPHYYSLATIAYIGRNHGVLEPLRFKVPTVVAPRADWAVNYVTFPYYKQMIDEKGIIEAPDKADLGRIFLKLVDEPGYGAAFVENALRVAERQKGAGRRIVEHIEQFVRRDRKEAPAGKSAA